MRKISFVCFLACLFAVAANARVCFLPNIFGGGESCLLGISDNTATPDDPNPQPRPNPGVGTCAEGTVSSKLSGENKDMFIYYETSSIATCYLVYCSGWRGSSTSNNINTSVWTTSSATYGGKLCYFATGCREPYRSNPCVGTETTEEEYHIDDLVCYRCQQHCPVVTCEGYTVKEAPENGRLVGSPCKIVNEDCSEGDVLYKFECNEGYTANGNTCEIAQCAENFATEEDNCVGSCAGTWKLGMVTSGKSGPTDCKNCVCCIPEADETYSDHLACYAQGTASDGCGRTKKTYTYLCTENQTCTSSGCCTPLANDTYNNHLACYTETTASDGCGGTRKIYSYSCTGNQTCTSSGCCTPTASDSTPQYPNCYTKNTAASDGCGSTRTTYTYNCTGSQTCISSGCCTPLASDSTPQYPKCYTKNTAVSDGCGSTRTTYAYNCTGNQTCTSSGCCTPEADEATPTFPACYTQNNVSNGCGGTRKTYTYKCIGNEQCTSSGCSCTPIPDDTYSGYRACWTRGTADNGCGNTRITYTYRCTENQTCTSSGCEDPVVCTPLESDPIPTYPKCYTKNTSASDGCGSTRTTYTYTCTGNQTCTSSGCEDPVVCTALESDPTPTYPKCYIKNTSASDGCGSTRTTYTYKCSGDEECTSSGCVGCTPEPDDTYTGYRACWTQGSASNGCGSTRITYTYRCNGDQTCTSSGCCTPSGNGQGYSYANCMTVSNSDGCGGTYYTSKCTGDKVCNGSGSCVSTCTPLADDTYSGYLKCYTQGSEDNGCGSTRTTYTYNCTGNQVCRSTGCCTPSGDGQARDFSNCLTKMNSDGCGGYYYTSKCTGGKVCNGSGSCVDPCTPRGNGQAYDYNNCLTVSNSDGCGGTYYTSKCTGSQICNGSGSCVTPCTPSGNGQGYSYANCLTISNSDGCGGTYYTSSCTGNKVCNGSGSCVCKENSSSCNGEWNASTCTCTPCPTGYDWSITSIDNCRGYTCSSVKVTFAWGNKCGKCECSCPSGYTRGDPPYPNCYNYLISSGCYKQSTSKCTSGQTCENGSCVSAGCSKCSDLGSLWTATCNTSRCIKDTEYCGDILCYKYYSYGPNNDPDCDLCDAF